jgi:hypothetical protein
MTNAWRISAKGQAGFLGSAVGCPDVIFIQSAHACIAAKHRAICKGFFGVTNVTGSLVSL